MPCALWQYLKPNFQKMLYLNGILISVCWSLKCCWTRNSELRATRVHSEVKDIYSLQPHMPEEEGHKVLPHMERTPWTDRGGEMSRCWTGGIKATARAWGQSRLHQKGSWVGSLPRPPWSWGSVINRRHQVLAWQSKAEVWKWPLCKWGFTVLPGSSPEALEAQAGNRKLIRSVFELLLGWWVLLGLFIPLNYSNLPC